MVFLLLFSLTGSHLDLVLDSRGAQDSPGMKRPSESTWLNTQKPRSIPMRQHRYTVSSPERQIGKGGKEDKLGLQSRCLERARGPRQAGFHIPRLNSAPAGSLATHLLCVSNKRESTNVSERNTQLLILWIVSVCFSLFRISKETIGRK